MKTIQCDRCGKLIPYVPPYMNVAKDGYIPPKILMSIWDTTSQTIREVDLCEECMKSVYNYIYYSKDGSSA